MRRNLLFPISFLVLLASPAAADGLSRNDAAFPAALSFEVPLDDGVPRGWSGRPRKDLSLDHSVVHSGKSAGRIDRTVGSARAFSTLTASIPVDFEGTTIELAGFVRMENVSDFAGFWLRTDDLSSPLAFDSMQRLEVNGTRDWTEYRIHVPLSPAARKVVFGVLLSGTGTVWADSLGLYVDGKPVSELPTVEHSLSILETDHEFDDGSGIAVDSLNDSQFENLSLLARVWGFLKYHHPDVTGGRHHWDYELFRVLPAVLAAADAAESNAALGVWAARIGLPEDCDPCARAPEDPQLAADIGWIHDTDLLGDELSGYLQSVYRNRHSGGSQFYVTVDPPGQPHPAFINEPAYADVEIDDGYRLLALFRLWNMAEYWFPYRDVIGEPWEEVLQDMLPVFIAAETADDYTLATFRLLARLNDTHADLHAHNGVRPPTGECQLPVAMRFVGEQAVVATRLDESEELASTLKVGDILLELAGRPVERLLDEWSPYYPASNEPARLRNIAWYMTRGPCGDVDLLLQRGSDLITASATRVAADRVHGYALKDQSRPGATLQWLTEGVAYLTLATIERDEVAGYMEEIQDARGLVVDIRNYPAEFVVFDLAGHLVSEAIEFASFTGADLANPGTFDWFYTPSLQPLHPQFPGKVAVLVNEVTQSQAEYTAMSLRAAPATIIVGSTTAGADGNFSPVVLPGGLRTGFSGLGVFYPDGSPTQRTGIVPDVFVSPTVAGIRSGRDEVLAAAVREILGASPDRMAE